MYGWVKICQLISSEAEDRLKNFYLEYPRERLIYEEDFLDNLELE